MKLILYNSPESEEDRNGLKPSERIRIPCKKAVRLEIAQSMRIPPYGFSESKEQRIPASLRLYWRIRRGPLPLRCTRLPHCRQARSDRWRCRRQEQHRRPRSEPPSRSSRHRRPIPRSRRERSSSRSVRSYNPGITAHTGEHALDHFVGYRMREQNQEVRIADSLPALPRPGGGHSPQLVS